METINTEVVASIANACNGRLSSDELTRDYDSLVEYLEGRVRSLEEQNKYLERLTHAN